LLGVLRAVIWLAAACVAFLASRALMPGVIRLLGGVVGESGIATGALQIVLGMMVFVCALAAGRIVHRRLGRTERGELRPWNRQIGGLVGFIAGIGLGLIVLLGLDTYSAMGTGEVEGRFAGAVRRSRLRRMVRPYNPLRDYLLPDALTVLVMARDDPQVLEDLQEEPHIQDLLNDPKVEAVLQDEELMEAVKNHHLKVLVESDKVRTLLKDEDLRARLFSQETRETLNRVEEKARERQADEPDEEAPE
jgi:hypothetical protein